MKGFSMFVLVGVWAAGTVAASGSAVPFVYRSAPTDEATAPVPLVARSPLAGGIPVRLVSAPSGRLAVSFDAGSASGRYVYLGFSFDAPRAPLEPYAIEITSEQPLASVQVLVNGIPFPPVSGNGTAYAVSSPPIGTPHVQIRLERGSAPEVPLLVSLHQYKPCQTIPSGPCDAVLDSPPTSLAYDLSDGIEDKFDSQADVLVPAIVRGTGLHGLIRSRLSVNNMADAPVTLSLHLRSLEGGFSNVVPLTVPARTRSVVSDLVAFLFPTQDPVEQGTLEIHGFVPASPGDLTVETAYEGGPDGRVGTTLPVFYDPLNDGSPVLLTSTSKDDPRLILFSGIPAQATNAVSRRVTLRVTTPDGTAESVNSINVDGYVSAKLSELLGSGLGESAISVETDDPSIHAVLVRSDPVTGCPFVVASR